MSLSVSASAEAKGVHRLRRPAPSPRVGEYTLIRELGSGATGRVYLARGRDRSRYVAVKMLHEHLASDVSVERELFDEALLAGSMNHPNVVRALDFGRSAQGAYLVLEYVPGASLSFLLTRGLFSRLLDEPGLAVRIVVDALSGLAAAHRLCDASGRLVRLVHRDLSPRNLLLGSDGALRITDFGIALTGGEAVCPDRPRGTAAYMSPEQVRGAALDQRTDIWSIGAVAYELLAGAHPFKGDSPGETLFRIVGANPRPIRETNPEVPEVVEDAVLRALEKDREWRYESADAFRSALLEAWTEEAPLPSRRRLAETVADLLGAALHADVPTIDANEAETE